MFGPKETAVDYRLLHPLSNIPQVFEKIARASLPPYPSANYHDLSFDHVYSEWYVSALYIASINVILMHAYSLYRGLD